MPTGAYLIAHNGKGMFRSEADESLCHTTSLTNVSFARYLPISLETVLAALQVLLLSTIAAHGVAAILSDHGGGDGAARREVLQVPVQ